MSEMIERVARAMYESNDFKKPWNDPDTQRRWRKGLMRNAYAAIEAMREPTAEITSALLHELSENEDNPNTSIDAVHVWQELIDIALKDDPS